MSLLELKPNGMYEPHWHPNANVLCYCLGGSVLMTLVGPGSRDTFLVEAGAVAFVPMGTMYHIENMGTVPVKMLLCFDNATPEDMEMSSSVGAMQGLAEKPVFIAEEAHHPTKMAAWQTNRYKMALGTLQPHVSSRGGSVKMCHGAAMPVLKGLSVYLLQLEPKGSREPHWHPNANELNYLISGTARMTVLSPGGNVEAYDMKAGDMSFLPMGYLHRIENTGDVPARFAIFYSNSDPSEIGISGCMEAYPSDALSAVFNVPVEEIEKVSKQDNFVVFGAG